MDHDTLEAARLLIEFARNHAGCEKDVHEAANTLAVYLDSSNDL